jgi:hypothetical protein
MKSNDIFESSGKLDELRLSNLIGGAAAAKAKSMFGGGGKTATTILAQEIFVKDFVSDAVSSLENAIASGLIGPPQPGGKETPPPASPEPDKPTGETPPQAPAQPQGQPQAGAQPAAAGAQPAAAGAKAARPQGDAGKAQAARIQAMNNYLKGVSQQMSKIQDQAQKQELSKEMINYMMDRQGTPEWENGLKTVEFILNKNTDPKFAMASIQKLKGGKQMNVNPANAPKGNVAESQWQAYWLNKLAESCGFTLKQLGFTVLLENKRYRVVESRYFKMNKVFESMILLEQGQPFGQYFKDWFGQYMQGVDFTSNKPALYAIIDQIEDTYNNKKGKIDTANLNKLAQGGWAASKAVGINPSGAQDAAGAQPAKGAQGAQGAQAQGAQAAQPQAQAQGQAQAAQPAQAKAAGGAENGYQIAQRIKSELNKLYKIDQVVYNDLVKSLQSKPVTSNEPPAVAMTGQEKPNTLGGAGYTSAQPAQQKVSESAKRAERLKKLLARD